MMAVAPFELRCPTLGSSLELDSVAILVMIFNGGRSELVNLLGDKVSREYLYRPLEPRKRILHSVRQQGMLPPRLLSSKVGHFLL